MSILVFGENEKIKGRAVLYLRYQVLTSFQQ
jgi:hypothetical protein